MKFFVFDNGGADDMPREARVCTGAPFDPTDVLSIPCMTFLIDHPDGLILYDAGWSQSHRHIRDWSIPEEKSVLSRLSQLKLSPKDIRTVIMSHLHHDHSGYLEYFTNSEIIISEREFTGVAKLYALGQLQEHGGLYIKSDYEAWLKANLNWKLIGDNEKIVKIAEGVELLHFGSGHCFGILCLVVKLPKTGNIIVAGDTIYCAENLEPPMYSPRIYYDKQGYESTIGELLVYQRKLNAQLWFGHDIDQFNSLIKSTEGYYE